MNRKPDLNPNWNHNNSQWYLIKKWKTMEEHNVIVGNLTQTDQVAAKLMYIKTQNTPTQNIIKTKVDSGVKVRSWRNDSEF